MDSLRLGIAENLESLGLSAMDAQSDELAMRLWHGADTLRWCEARERVDEQLDVAELEARVEDLEWQVQDQAATVRKVLRGEHADVEALRKAIEAAIE